MGILKSKGVHRSSIDRGRHNGAPTMDTVIYNGSPKQNFFYLYTLPSENFVNRPKGSLQWISSKPVKPLKVERLPIREYMNLIRKATKKEKEDWNKEYGDDEE